MTEPDDMADRDAIGALLDWLAVQADNVAEINTVRMIEACMFSLMYFGDLDEEFVSELAAEAIKHAGKRLAYERTMDFMHEIKGAKQ